MKISELISILEKVKEESGDLPVASLHNQAQGHEMANYEYSEVDGIRTGSAWIKDSLKEAVKI